jgi:transposase-like protein
MKKKFSYRMMRAWRLPVAQKKAAVEEYVSGGNSETIAGQLGIGANTLLTWVRLAGKEVRPKGETQRKYVGAKLEAILADYRAGMKSREIAIRHGVCESYIPKLCTRGGVVTRKPRRFYDPDAFQRDDEATAYWIGFLMTDGCLHRPKRQGRCQLVLTLQERDTDHVRLLQRYMQATHPVRHGSSICTLGPSKRVCRNARLAVSILPHTVDALLSHGITPRKTHTCQALRLADNRHFWRGAIDGDGTISFVQSPSGRFTVHVSLVSASPTFIRQFAAFCESVTGSPVRVFRNGTIEAATVVTHDALVLLRHLYGDATVALKRKAITAQLLLAAPENVFIGSYSRTA